MPAVTQREAARAVLRRQGMARLYELRDAGVTAATVSRMAGAGEIVRLARGLYQLPDADLDAAECLWFLPPNDRFAGGSWSAVPLAVHISNRRAAAGSRARVPSAPEPAHHRLGCT